MMLEVLLALLAVVAVLYDVSAPFRFTSRCAFMYGSAIFFGLLCLPQGFYRPCDLHNGARFVRPLRLVSWALGIRWHVRDSQLLAGDGGAVIVSNHQSAVDVLGMVELWPVVGRLASVIKKEVWLGLPFALAAWLCGQVFVDRRNPQKAKRQLNQVAGRLGPEKIKLWIFPEGTRGNGVSFLPFKKGAFHMAINAQVPVLPVVFSSYKPLMDRKQWRFDAGDIIAQVLPPIETDGMTSEDVPALLEKTQKVMEQAFAVINKQHQARQFDT